MSAKPEIGQKCVIVRGRYAGECGIVYAMTAETADVLIGSPKHNGDRVLVYQSSLDLY